MTAFGKYENIDKPAGEILTELIDHIKVHEGGGLTVRFKFADESRRRSEHIKANR